MKLLLVFVSALVLVAHGDATLSEEEDRVYTVNPEIVADDAGQEADDVEDTEIDGVPASESEVYIPSVARACNNAACANVCHRLGFIYGKCTAPTLCWCHN
ncbi:hypothetical protein PYW08_015215 [Mythimna loreyi]|uniref:Uncharacterized protein n=2 Tax=Mythimna loreyi TaxID=667449 RepID=A0ACC2QV63_9NEOP|nr:hypothetical protein PYW08_015213 [Mythimna loreyi]KAJ8726818.1 hypothetical protein PYW08_015215 [Mythimna loreyi]